VPSHSVQGPKQLPVEAVGCRDGGHPLVDLRARATMSRRRVCGDSEDGDDQDKACRKARPRKRMPSLT
jgi:hypothetical protein